jgi:hypothetical protein
MNQWLGYVSLILTFCCSQGFAVQAIIEHKSYWQCTASDRENKIWSAKSEYQKVSLNVAYEACKKESNRPLTCKVSKDDCEGFHQRSSIKPVWQCTAFDLIAAAWMSNFHPNRDDAAFAAKGFCKAKSSVPESCYINLVTCMVYINGVRQ